MTVEMLYDSVEKSRRRALREMRLLAAAGASDLEIRSRIEDYFREGDLAPQLEQLTESTSFDIDDWVQALAGLSVADEGELRGSTARLLESYPDHPGLLLGRALAELMGGESSFEFSDDFGRALEFGEGRYAMSGRDLERMAVLMLDFAAVYKPEWRPLIWDRTLPLLNGEDPWDVLVGPGGEGRAVAGERVLYLNERLQSGVDFAVGLLEDVTGGRGDE